MAQTAFVGVTDAGATVVFEGSDCEMAEAAAAPTDADGAAAECDAALHAPPAPTMMSPGR